ncbi:MAG TPA: hypothetical protein VMR21_08345 [Vicinamibacteria bacterium]|nr:hypothetical protein [Vicinamibacteria bacterium]
MAQTSRFTTRELVLVPAIITLAVTLLRLTGELQGWSPALFSRQGGGGWALIGIVWLVFVFGIYFAIRLARAGQGPPSVGWAVGYSLLGLILAPASAAVATAAGAPQLRIIGLVSIVFLAGAWVACRGWRELGNTLFVYALAARVPVVLVMLAAILGSWGTHYDAVPPGFPAMGPVATWALIGLFPQLTLWVGFTVTVGMFFGSVAVAIVRPRPRQAVAPAA